MADQEDTLAQRDPAVENEPDYEVGYGRPPKGTRFQPGRSGNPGGRPRNSLNLKTTFQQVMSEPVTVIKNGVRTRVTSFAAVSHKVQQQALEGNVPSQRTYFSCAERFGEDESTSTQEHEDRRVQQKLYADYIKRRKRLAATEPAPAAEPARKKRPINVIP